MVVNYILPIKVSNEKKIVFHIFIRNEVTGNSIRKIKILLRKIIVPPFSLHKHLPESLSKAMVACMVMETDALTYGTAFKHHRHWWHDSGNKIIIKSGQCRRVSSNKSGGGVVDVGEWECSVLLPSDPFQGVLSLRFKSTTVHLLYDLVFVFVEGEGI